MILPIILFVITHKISVESFEFSSEINLFKILLIIFNMRFLDFFRILMYDIVYEERWILFCITI